MNLRQFVFAGLLAAGGPKTVQAQSASQQIIVIGAGLAGLTAARALRDVGHQVMVLESRDRVGGRIHTSHLWPDLTMDLGASWIHGTKGNPLNDLATKAGAARVATSYDASVMIGTDGDRIDPDLREAEHILSAAWSLAEQRDADMSVWQAVKATPDWANAPKAQRRLVQHLINATLEQEYGSPADQLSAWHHDAAKVFSGQDMAFPGGFSQLTGWLAQGLDIRLSHPVARVAPGQVTLADGRQFKADRVLVTVPLGVLQAGKIAFDAALHPSRAKAVAGLRMGLLNKSWLRFDKVVWPQDVDWIEWLGPKPGQWSQWLSLGRAMRAPVLLGFNAGDEAAALEPLSDRETIALATGALRAMFGSAFPAPLAGQVTRWGQDPWSLGSYSFNAVGTTPETRRALAGSDWEETLWFAGEACEPHYFGTAHGAVLSGAAAAMAMGA